MAVFDWAVKTQLHAMAHEIRSAPSIGMNWDDAVPAVTLEKGCFMVGRPHTMASMIPQQTPPILWRKSIKISIASVWYLWTLLSTSTRLAAADKPAATPADLIFRHGSTYTLDASRSWAEAVTPARIKCEPDLE